MRMHLATFEIPAGKKKKKNRLEAETDHIT